MAMKLDRFEVLNKQRGTATVRASFDVNLGPLIIKGWELILHNGKDFLAVPSRSYKAQGSDEWRRFNFVAFEGDRGSAMQGEILQLARAEFTRRNGPPADTPTSDGGYADDLPF